jgi:hypothetical protein
MDTNPPAAAAPRAAAAPPPRRRRSAAAAPPPQRRRRVKPRRRAAALPRAARAAYICSPIGTQTFLTSVASIRNSLPSPWSGSIQSRAPP